MERHRGWCVYGLNFGLPKVPIVGSEMMGILTAHSWSVYPLAWLFGIAAGMIGAWQSNFRSSFSELHVASAWMTLTSTLTLLNSPTAINMGFVVALNAGVYAGCYLVRKINELRVVV
jgi:hypothetical protein